MTSQGQHLESAARCAIGLTMRSEVDDLRDRPQPLPMEGHAVEYRPPLQTVGVSLPGYLLQGDPREVAQIVRRGCASCEYTWHQKIRRLRIIKHDTIDFNSMI